MQPVRYVETLMILTAHLACFGMTAASGHVECLHLDFKESTRKASDGAVKMR
jgi:hypothetical protein